MYKLSPFLKSTIRGGGGGGELTGVCHPDILATNSEGANGSKMMVNHRKLGCSHFRVANQGWKVRPVLTGGLKFCKKKNSSDYSHVLFER